MTPKSLTLNTKALKARMLAAEIKAVNDTMAMAINHARQNHDWDSESGELLRSIAVKTNAHEDENGVSGLWGSLNIDYALIHELGGVIEPKNSKFLAVPMTDLARKAGSPRNLVGLAYVQSIKGQPMLVDEESGEVHYLLRRQVTVPARPFLRPAADATYPKLIDNLKKAWDRLAPGSGSPLASSEPGGPDAS